MFGGIGIRVGLDEEVYYLKGYQGDSLEAEVLIPKRMMVENERDLLSIGSRLVGIDIGIRLYTIKELIDQYEDFDVPKRLTIYVIEELEQSMRVSLESIDKVFKIAVNEGTSQIGTEWEYQDDYEYVLVNNLVNEEDKEEYDRYIG